MLSCEYEVFNPWVARLRDRTLRLRHPVSEILRLQFWPEGSNRTPNWTQFRRIHLQVQTLKLCRTLAITGWYATGVGWRPEQRCSCERSPELNCQTTPLYRREKIICSQVAQKCCRKSLSLVDATNTPTYWAVGVLVAQYKSKQNVPIESIGLYNDQSLVFFHPIHCGVPSLSLNCKTSFPRFTVMAIIKGSFWSVTCEPVTVTLSPKLRW